MLKRILFMVAVASGQPSPDDSPPADIVCDEGSEPLNIPNIGWSCVKAAKIICPPDEAPDHFKNYEDKFGGGRDRNKCHCLYQKGDSDRDFEHQGADQLSIKKTGARPALVDGILYQGQDAASYPNSQDWFEHARSKYQQGSQGLTVAQINAITDMCICEQTGMWKQWRRVGDVSPEDGFVSKNSNVVFDCQRAYGGRLVNDYQDGASCPEGTEPESSGFNTDVLFNRQQVNLSNCVCKDRTMRQTKLIPDNIKFNLQVASKTFLGPGGDYEKYAKDPMRCEACPPGMNVNPNKLDECVCPFGQKFDDIKQRCVCNGEFQRQSRAQAPFACIECPSDQTVSKTDPTKCVCPVGQKYDAARGRCVCNGGNERQSKRPNPRSNPFTCQECPAGQTLSRTDPTQCLCPPGQTYDSAVQACVCPTGQSYDVDQEQCVCPPPQIKNISNPNRCDCPAGFKKDPDDASKCVPLRILPKRPLHDNGPGLESVPAGVDNIKRKTTLQLVSVSPLDRLLNQLNTDDNIQVTISCYPRKEGEHPHENWPIGPVKDYKMVLKHDQINTETCYDGKVPNENQDCPTPREHAQECEIGDDFKVEVFNLAAASVQGLSGPLSLGYQIVTREQVQCLGQDKIKIHFEYGKRQKLSGAETCFDHTPYLVTTQDGQVREDSIPFTVLDICNKANPDRKRCFFYSYQVTLHVGGPVDILPKLFVKIRLNSMSGLVVLPGDQIKASFMSSYTEQDSVRVMPEIYDQNMPSPIKERYQLDGVTRLPCDDRKVADHLKCEDFFVFCTDPNQEIHVGIQGSGEIYTIKNTCEGFMAQVGRGLGQGSSFSWRSEESLMTQDFNAFSQKYSEGTKRKVFKSNTVEFTNKYSQTQRDRWFEFEYEVGHRLHSNEPRCYQGVYMPPSTPVCKFKCAGLDCFLKGPAPPNTGKRMLVGADGRPDVSPPTPGQFEKRFLQKLSGPDQRAAQWQPGGETPPVGTPPLDIPTRIINTSQYYLPGIKLDSVLSNYIDNLNRGGANRRMLSSSVIEGEISGGRAILSAGLDLAPGSTYEFQVKDKLRQDAAPPSAIRIEKLPKYGKIVITNHDGTTKELQVGDIVSTQLMSNFKYDQGDQVCSRNNNEVCNDEFLYSTLSSWVGIGKETTAEIKLTPVAGPAFAVENLSSSPEEIKVTPTVEQKQDEENEVKAPVTTESGECQDFSPAFINAMIGITSLLALIVISQAAYYMYAKKQQAGKKAAEEANKDFDAVVENQQ